MLSRLYLFKSSSETQLSFFSTALHEFKSCTCCLICQNRKYKYSTYKAVIFMQDFFLIVKTFDVSNLIINLI